MEINYKLKSFLNIILYHQTLLSFSPYICYKYFCTDLLLYETTKFTKYLYEKNNKLRQEKIFSLEELKYFDGTNGKPTYVAIGKNVYDLSGISKWKNGSHFGLYAGTDLTNQFNTCHGNIDKLKTIPIIGTLQN